MTPAILLTLASIHLAAVMAPGANFLMVTQNALTYSRSIGLLTVIGVATGSALYVTAGLIGFTAIISQSPLLYTLIRAVGVIYFVYTSYKMFKRQPRAQTIDEPHQTTDRTLPHIYRNSVFTAIANPASAIYFLSLFTTFIPMNIPLAQKALAGVMLLSITASWYALVALFFSNGRIRAAYHRFELWINRIFGVVWLLLALRLLVG